MQYSDRATMLKKCAGVISSTLLVLRTLLTLFTLLACSNIVAAELGEATVRSYHGQPLALDIELTALAPDEVTGLQAKLASQDVYRSANVRIHPALTSLRITTRQDGVRQFLHVTTSQAIDVDYLHLFLELTAGGRHTVRTITVWLPADPAPQPAFQQTRQQTLQQTRQQSPASLAPLADRSAAGAANQIASEAAGVPANRVDDLAGDSAKNGAKNDAKNGAKSVANSGAKSGAKSGINSTAHSEAANAAKKAAADDAVRVSEQANVVLGLENADLKSRIATLEQKNVALQQVDASKQAAVALALAVAEKPAQASSGSSLAIAGALLLGLTVLGFFGFRYRKTLAASVIGIVSSKLLRRKASAPAAHAASTMPTTPTAPATPTTPPVDAE